MKERRIYSLAILTIITVLAAVLTTGCSKKNTTENGPEGATSPAAYASMEDYVASVIDALKQPDGYTYSILPKGAQSSADGTPIEVTEAAADVRVTDLTKLGDCMNLAPDGALELWSFSYEVKPEDKAGALPDRFFWVGGNSITDDGYIFDGWTYYLTMLRTDDDPDAYKLLDSQRTNDGLWHNGCDYDNAYKYLYDFYADYVNLDVPRYVIPDFFGPDATGLRYDGDGWCLYTPLSTFSRTTTANEDCWYSAYQTGSTLRVDKSMDSVEMMEEFYRSSGFTLEQYLEGAALSGPWLRHDADSGTQFANYLMPIAEGGCYIISTYWMPTDDDSVNEWGYSKKNHIENEAVTLRAMAQSFMVGNFTDLYVPSFETDIKLASGEGAAVLVLSSNGAERGSFPLANTWNKPRLTDYIYEHMSGGAPQTDGGAVLTLWLSNNDSSTFCFYEGTNTVGYFCGGDDAGDYYEVQDSFEIIDNDERTLYDRMLDWYNEAEFAALRGTVDETPIPDHGQSWQEAAQEWIDAYEGAHIGVRSGSQFKFTWVKNTIRSAEEDVAQWASERQPQQGENKYYFYTTTEFVPENKMALNNAMAGNTGGCDDPNAPDGAYEYYRCCSITLREDGWHGTMYGTGW